MIGFVVYRLYTFKKELDHYAHLVTSKDYRILIPYTLENPDRLIRYGLCVAKKEDGEINILRVITVPTQTPFNAGIAFAPAARKSFDSLHKIIDLLITDLRTFINNKKLQTLVTHGILLIYKRR
jgi:basic amino acid/polyamine antiporter, APA family